MILIRVYCRSEENDRKSMLIERAAHCQIELINDGLFLKSNNSRNGTKVDDESVAVAGMILKRRAAILELADALILSMRWRHTGDVLPDGKVHEKILGQMSAPMWKLAGAVEIRTLILERISNLGSKDRNGCEKYVIIYRAADIGSHPICAISIPDKELQSRHAAILHLGQCFYLENISHVSLFYALILSIMSL